MKVYRNEGTSATSGRDRAGILNFPGRVCYFSFRRKKSCLFYGWHSAAVSKHRKENKESSPRLSFPDDEKKLSWLSLLLEAYAVVDRGVFVAVAEEKRRWNKRLACRKGCDNCCRTHADIPVYPLELVGIYWFVSEKMADPLREVLRGRLSENRDGNECPFLVNDSCSVHLIRPVSCRQFNVFGNPCGEGEDPYYTRRSDVLTPIQGYTNKAFSTVLPFYGIAEGEGQAQAVNRIIHTQAVNLQTYDWKRLVGVMNNLDSEKRRIAGQK